MNYIKKLIAITVLIFSIASCYNEPFEDIPAEKIEVGSELYRSMEQLANKEKKSTDEEPVCITFVYPFNVYLYNENEEIVDQRIVLNNVYFIGLLESMSQNAYIGLSYPINTVTDEGELFSINDNEELKNAIKACIEEEIIGQVSSILEEPNCIWEITSMTQDTSYNDAIIEFYNDGTGVLYDKGNAYRMSWISLFIEEELHINIKVEGNSEVGEHWNFDWRAYFTTNNNVLEIYNGNKSYKIKSACDVENSCDYVEFRECTSEVPEKAEFIFENYKECILSLQEDLETPEQIELSFYETKQDLEDNVNPLSTTSYINNSDPQIIFVKLEDIDDDLSSGIRIVLKTESCQEED